MLERRSCFRFFKFSTIVLICMFSLVFAEKEPVEIEIVKTNSPPSVKGHNFENAETNTIDDGDKGSNLGFIHAFVASISVIIVSELGDKTFFIAAIMAMRHPRLTVFLGAIAALALMTVLSGSLAYSRNKPQKHAVQGAIRQPISEGGRLVIVHAGMKEGFVPAVFGLAATIIPRAFTYYISTALFALFGLKMLKDGYSMSPNEGQEEFEEVQSDLRKRDDEYEKEAVTSLIQDPESGVIRKSAKQSARMLSFISRTFLQSFSLTFVAEWGDRSQLTTIILAAREDVIGVTIGGVLGHALCTGLAVMGGRMIAQRISVRTVTLIGGVVFLFFAASALFFNSEGQ